MCKLVNRIRYGKSEKPRFIKSKGHWLYKNKWIDTEEAYRLMSDHQLSYTYELQLEGYASFGECDSFDEIVDLKHRYPTQLSFPDLSQFSMQEVNILLGIQEQYIRNQSKKIRKSIVEMNEEIEKIQLKIFG